jgi:hypothetical protein
MEHATEPSVTTVVRKETVVQRDHRVEITTPELPVGANVDVVVTAQNTGERRIIAFLDSLPPVPRSASCWAALEQSLQADRDAWDH